MTEAMTRIGDGGRVVIPSELRRAVGLKVGDPVIFVLDGDRLLLFTPQQALARARAVVRKVVPKGRALSQELIRERRREARHE